jgi:cytosine/adenosine deaminase-related metal-dependent hydrolase
LLELLQEGADVGLGTDSAMSGNNLDLFRQMSLIAPLQRLRKNDRTVLAARDMFRMATIGGAKALGMGEQTGSLEVGKWSDVVIFDAESIRHVPLHDPYATLVYSLQAADVKDVFIGGRRVVEEKNITLADSGLIREQAVNYIAGW